MLRQMLLLSGGAVPWDTLRTWSARRRYAAVVALRELRGEVFDWSSQTWRQP